MSHILLICADSAIRANANEPANLQYRKARQFEAFSYNNDIIALLSVGLLKYEVIAVGLS